MKEVDLIKSALDNKLTSAQLAEITEALSIYYFRERDTTWGYRLDAESRMFLKRAINETFI